MIIINRKDSGLSFPKPRPLILTTSWSKQGLSQQGRGVGLGPHIPTLSSSILPPSNFSVTTVSSKSEINRFTEDAKLKKSHQPEDRSKLVVYNAWNITQKHDVQKRSALY